MPRIDGDVVLESRVRLARNLSDLPFPGQMAYEFGEESQFRAADALAHTPEGRQYAMFRVRDMSDLTRRVLTERHIISRELLAAGEYAALLLRRDDQVGIMLNEEDHLRICAMLPGNALPEAADMASVVDTALGRRLCYAFDAELGFLTSCPANAGTGLRASVMLHMPSLLRSGAIGPLTQELSRLGLLLRPLGGKEGAPEGDLFLLQNQISLGRSEEELLDTVRTTVNELVDRERSARELMLLSADSRLPDRLFRSLGILRYARRLSEAEWVRRWSDVRLGVQAGLFSIDLKTLDDLLTAAKPAHLEQAAGKDLSPAERDEQRALLVRESLS